jgi:glycyl-tRNA synthetase beta chain
MVNEFANLQGIMGNIYANVVDGEPENVCNAIEEMYKPRSADDSVPKSIEGALVSIADRIDTLVGCCAVGLGPTGSADPYALRRQSLGMLKTIIEHNLHFSIKNLLEEAAKKFKLDDSKKIVDDVVQIIQGRFETLLKENGVRYDVINAVIDSGWDDVSVTVDKAAQLMEIVDSDEFKKACTVVERCHNITKTAELSDTEVDEDLFEEKLENELWAEWKIVKPEFINSIGNNDYKSAVKNITGKFYDKLNVFFDDVRVNAENEKLKTNRLKLVRSFRNLIVDKLADLSKIVFTD